MTTFVDQILIGLGLLPKIVVGAPSSGVTATTKDEALGEATSLEHLRDIPRYPPFMEGLPIYPPATLLATQKELVGGIRQIIANESLLEEHYIPAMMRLAALVQLLPASQAHHHRGAGGMLRHSLEVGLWALQQTEGKLIRGVVTPQQRHIIEPRWKLTVFLAGICHDLGKVVTDIAVTDRENKLKWRPYHQGLYDWAKSNSVNNYFLHWQEGRGKKHTNVSSTLINTVIKENTLDWISDGGTEAVIWLTESLNNNPGSTNQIHNFVVKADQLSVERDLKSMGVAMAGYEIGVPVERYLTDIMRRLVQEGIWRINEPSARVWNIDGTTYLVWPMAGEEIARRTRDEDVPGLPKTADGVLDMMVEREIAFMRDSEGDPFYYISPDVITEKIPNMRMKAIRLRDQALISRMPIAPISGKIHSSKIDLTENKEPASTSTVRLTGQAELPLNSQGDSSASVVHVVNVAVKTKPPQSIAGTSVEHGTPVEHSTPVEHLAIIKPMQVEPQPNLAATDEFRPPTITRPAQKLLTVADLDGAMGELLKIMLDEFNGGKKSFDVLGAKQSDGSVYLKWPDAFAGYGFTPKQILTELSELSWLIPASDVAKVGDAVFAGGVAKSIKLSAVVGCLFGQIENQPINQPKSPLKSPLKNPPKNQPINKPGNQLAPTLVKMDESTVIVDTAAPESSFPATSFPVSNFGEVFRLTESNAPLQQEPAMTVKKPRKQSSKKVTEKKESDTAPLPFTAKKNGCQLFIMFNKSSKGKSSVASN